MGNFFGIFLLLLLCYCIGWLASFVVLLIGSAKSRLQIAIAHAYAILLLLISMQIISSDAEPILAIFCFFDFLAIILFLFLYARGVKNSKKGNLVKEIHAFIKTD